MNRGQEIEEMEEIVKSEQASGPIPPPQCCIAVSQETIEIPAARFSYSRSLRLI